MGINITNVNDVHTMHILVLTSMCTYFWFSDKWPSDQHLPGCRQAALYSCWVGEESPALLWASSGWPGHPAASRSGSLCSDVKCVCVECTGRSHCRCVCVFLGWNELLIASFSHRSVTVKDGILLATGLHVHRSSAHSAGVGSIFDRSGHSTSNPP